MTSHENNFPVDDSTDDPLELAVRALKQEAVPAGPSAETIAATLKSLEARELNSKKTILAIPRSRLMKIAKAGSGLLLTSCVVIALVALRSPTSAYAQVIENARKAKSMSYVSTITTPSLPQGAVVREFVAEDGRSRTEHMFDGKPSGLVTISDAGGYTRLQLSDAAQMMPPGRADRPLKGRKTATVYPAQEGSAVTDGGHKNSWLKSLQSLKDKPEKGLGRKQLEGKTVLGFEATFGKIPFQMWVDSASGRPVRIDYDTPFDQHVTMTEFRFDERLDESLFSFDPPADYEVRHPLPIPKVAGGEESLIIALSGYTAKSEGRFPSSLTEWGEWSVLFSKDSKTGLPDEETTRVMANLGAITPFLSGMNKSDYAYCGKGKTTADKDVIVFWYKKADGTYRAVYGDLSAKDIEAKDVPKD